MTYAATWCSWRSSCNGCGELRLGLEDQGLQPQEGHRADLDLDLDLDPDRGKQETGGRRGGRNRSCATSR